MDIKNALSYCQATIQGSEKIWLLSLLVKRSTHH